MLRPWATRGLKALVLIAGTATTIATSAPPEFRLTETVDVTREAGQRTSVVLLVDPETVDEYASFTTEITISSTEDFGLLTVVPSGTEASSPARVEEPTLGADGLYTASMDVWSEPECYEGGVWCSNVIAVETAEDVPHELTIAGHVVQNQEFEEGARFIMEVE
ncbi:MAG TPA: hypothetical protein RMH99_24205 [Sandaracinaceae bacterium LLY-WYZ-13_1]|nr:hypothetical protein [Sandaracinaceae bacterium LLY-WYZ-13_1]